MTSQRRAAHALLVFCVSTLGACLLIMAVSGSADPARGWPATSKDIPGRDQFSPSVSYQSALGIMHHNSIVEDRRKRSVSPDTLREKSRSSSSGHPRHDSHVTQSLQEHCFARQHREFCGATVIIFTHSRVENFKLRTSIRETWGKKDILLKHNVQLYFVVGAPAGDNTVLMQALQSEVDMHGDILGLRVIDGYHNLTAKSMCMLHWIQAHCDNSEYIVKTDDDTFVNVSRLQEHIHHSLSPLGDKTMLGHVIQGASPRRNRNQRYYTPLALYRENTYPPFLSGSAYVLRRHLVSPVLEAVRSARPLWLEDVYVTGLLRQRIGARLVHSDQFIISKETNKFRADTSAFVSLHSVSAEEMYFLFDKLEHY